MSVKTSILKCLNASGFNSISRFLNRDRTVVLMYHGVVRDDWDIANENWLQVKESEFRKQMIHLKKHYDVVSLEVAMQKVGKKQNKPRAVITFDDGYENNYTVAYPILKELNLPATIFLVSSVIGTDKLFWYDRLRSEMLGHKSSEEIENTIQSLKIIHPHSIYGKVYDILQTGRYFCKYPFQREAYGPLNKKQIHEMQDSGVITFDSHTEHHEILTKLVGDEAETSICHSLEQLRRIGVKCGNFFCYPNGCYDKKHIETLSSLGFKGAVSTRADCWGPRDHSYEIPRFGVGRNLEMIQFKSLVSGMWKHLGNISQAIKGVLR